MGARDDRVIKRVNAFVPSAAAGILMNPNAPGAIHIVDEGHRRRWIEVCPGQTTHILFAYAAVTEVSVGVVGCGTSRAGRRERRPGHPEEG